MQFVNKSSRQRLFISGPEPAPFEPGGVTAGASAECTCGVISEAARYRRIFQFYADIKAVTGFKGKTG